MNNTNEDMAKPERTIFKRRCPACKIQFDTVYRFQICCSGRCRKARHDAKIRRLLSLAKRAQAQQARAAKGQ